MQKFQRGGLYMGEVGMEGERGTEIAKLAEVIKREQAKFKKGMGIRGLVGGAGDLLKKWIPGVGHAIDFVASDMAKSYTDIGDPEKIKEQKSFYAGEGKKKYGEAFEEAVEEAEGDPLQDLIASGLDYFGTDVGMDILGSGKDWLKNLFGGSGLGGGGVSQAMQTTGFFQEGGMIPTSNQMTSPNDLMRLLSSLQEQQGGANMGGLKKGGLGGSISNNVPTISDFFGKQGKSLDGSNKQSLAEILGRR